MAEVVVVTGSASGIGRATAERLHDAGHAVVGIDRDEAGLDALRAELAERLRGGRGRCRRARDS